MPDTAAGRIKEALARKRMSRARLAAEAKVSLSALEKMLAGQRKFSEQALVRIGGVLGLGLAEKVISAPDELGGYARSAVSWLEGNYLTLRPSSKRADDIFSYVTDVTWDEAAAHLVFRETARVDKEYAQHGVVAVPHQTGHIYFSTNRHGQHRLAIMKRDPLSGEMFGLLLTLQQEKRAAFSPVAMPMVMMPIAGLDAPPALGVLGTGHKAYERYAGELAKVTLAEYARLLGTNR